VNTENQNTEFKETWRDDYMKTLAAFANTDGGVMVIGKDDDGNVKGILNSPELLEILPNKIVQKLNIHPLVKYIETDGLATIEIVVEAYNYAVSYNGKYYIRTGSTTQELADRELQRFLLARNKQTWESCVVDEATLEDIDFETVERFKRLSKSQIKGIEQETPEMILRKLRLIDKDNKLKRAAILLFGKSPQDFFLSSYFKIGKFSSLTEIITDNIIEGNLFQQLDEILDLLESKYLIKKVIGYENWQRKEELEFPEIALREAVINALIHKDYSGSHTQMKIFQDSIWIWNAGGLLEGLTVDLLRTNHESILRNELICNTFYKAGFIEAWGRGTIKIINACKDAGLPEPEFSVRQFSFEVVFKTAKFTSEYINSLNLNERQTKIVNYLFENEFITNSICQNINGVNRTMANRDINILIEKGVIKSSNKKGLGANYILNI